MKTRKVAILALLGALVATPTLAGPIKNWPEKQWFNKWAAKVVAGYTDPKIKCNKITGIDSTAVGAIRVKGIWCAQDQGLGSPGMNAAVRFIGQAVNTSFRREFAQFSGSIAISLWDKSSSRAFGSRDWE